MIPLESVKNIPIADVAQVLNIPLIRSGNTLQSAKCPGGHESKNGNCFSVNISGNYFQCFSCGVSGDVVKLVQIGKGLTFTDSLKWLADNFGVSDDPNHKPLETEEKPKTVWTPKAADPKESDNETWQSKALSFISYAERQLEESPEIMGYLTEGRFLSPDTVKRFRLGYNPESVYVPCESFGLSGDKVLIPKGIVIPYLSGNRVLRLRIRKGAGEYHVVRGSYTTPYQADTGKSVWCIVESELDAMLIHQESADTVSVAALGSASIRPDESLNEKLMKAGKILCSMDFDEAGHRAFFGFWKKRYPNVSDFPVIEGKDPCEMVKAGIPIREWILSYRIDDLKAELGRFSEWRGMSDEMQREIISRAGNDGLKGVLNAIETAFDLCDRGVNPSGYTVRDYRLCLDLFDSVVKAYPAAHPEYRDIPRNINIVCTPDSRCPMCEELDAAHSYCRWNEGGLVISWEKCQGKFFRPLSN